MGGWESCKDGDGGGRWGSGEQGREGVLGGKDSRRLVQRIL